jgi:hypothetical protein
MARSSSILNQTINIVRGTTSIINHRNSTIEVIELTSAPNHNSKKKNNTRKIVAPAEENNPSQLLNR